jgi:hypothetical protein
MLTNSDKDQTKACLSSIFNLPLSLLFISVGDPFPNLDPDPHVSGPPGSGSISQRYGSESVSFYHPSIIKQKKKENPYFLPVCDLFWTFYL